MNFLIKIVECPKYIKQNTNTSTLIETNGYLNLYLLQLQQLLNRILTYFINSFYLTVKTIRIMLNYLPNVFDLNCDHLQGSRDVKYDNILDVNDFILNLLLPEKFMISVYVVGNKYLFM